MMFGAFEEYLCDRNDAIDNAAYQLIIALTANNPEGTMEANPTVPEWDMSLIGRVVDSAQEIIQEQIGYHCHPFYCNEIPCYLTDECQNTHCAMRQNESEIYGAHYKMEAKNE